MTKDIFGKIKKDKMTPEELMQMQMAVQQQAQPQQEYQMPVNPGLLGSQSSDIIRYRLESEDLMEVLEHDLRGDGWDPDAKKWVPMYRRWVNDDGLSACMGIVSRYVNRGSYLGNITKEEINFKCKAIKSELAKLFFKKSDLFELDKAMRKLLVRKIVDSIHLGLSRGEGGMESIQLSNMTNTQHVIHEDKTIQPQGNFMSMMPWNRNKFR